MNDFAPGRYDDYRIKLLYIVFRHKLAHVSHPYVGFDTSKVDALKSRSMRLAWSITAFPRAEAITLKSLRRPRAPRWPMPWPIEVDHNVEISVYTLAEDVIKTAPKYVAALKTDMGLQAKFRSCMDEFFQA